VIAPGRSVLIWFAALAAASCGRPGPPVVPAPRADPQPRIGAGLPATELFLAFLHARAAAATEMGAIAAALPAGARDDAIAWLIRSAPENERISVIAGLDAEETSRAREDLLWVAGSREVRERDAALGALARAGETGVAPLVAHGLRTARSEASIRTLSEAARRLDGLVPPDALETVLGRARTSDTLVVVTDALGAAIDADALRILAGHGLKGRAALERACAALRSRPDGEAPAQGRFDPPPRSAAPEPAIAVLRARAATVADADRQLRCALVRELAARVLEGGRDALGAAESLGALGGRDAVAALARGLFEGCDATGAAVTAALKRALRQAPEKTQEDLTEQRRLWAPLLAALVGEDEAAGPLR
jgi:hypothetical protein